MINEYFDLILPPLRWICKIFNIQEKAKPQEMLIVLIWAVVIVPLLVIGSLAWIIRSFI